MQISLSSIVSIKTSSFIRNMSIVMSGTAIAQIIAFALTPIISRLFTPGDYGVYGSYISILGVFGACVTLQYSQAIVLPKQDEDAANVFAVSIFSVLFITCIGGLLAYIFSEQLLNLLKTPLSKWLLCLLPLGIFIYGINQSFQAWCIRRKEFKKTASSQMIKAGSVNILQIIAGLFHYGSVGLVSSSIAADGIASLNLARQIICTDKMFLKCSFAWKQMIRLAFEYRDFPIYATTQNMMNTLSLALPVLLLSHYYGVVVAGAYAFGLRIVHVPFNFFLTALRQVLFQKVSEACNHGQQIYQLFFKATIGLATLSLPPSILFFFWSPSLFTWVFGKQWLVAGEYAGWLILWLMVSFCNVPSTLFARVLRKQKSLLYFEFFQLTLRALTLFMGGLCFDAYMTVILFSMVGVLSNFILIIWIAWVVKHTNSVEVSPTYE